MAQFQRGKQFNGDSPKVGSRISDLRFGLEYEWEPFTVAGEHLTFQRLAGRQVFPNECSHWGPAVFKWEGLITGVDMGEWMGKLGVFFGETEDISRRIQELATATRPSHHDYYLHEFLLSGDIRLFIFKPLRATFQDQEPGFPSPGFPDTWIRMAKRRALLAELLVLDCATRKASYVWLVNRVFDN